MSMIKSYIEIQIAAKRKYEALLHGTWIEDSCFKKIFSLHSMDNVSWNVERTKYEEFSHFTLYKQCIACTRYNALWISEHQVRRGSD